jgi:hypothetical protein
MSTRIDKRTLDSRLKVTTEAQNRARFAFFLSTLAAGINLAALWNTYLSWDRQWAYLPEKPIPWAQAHLAEQQIRIWVENQLVGVPLLGLRLSASDAAILGAIVLMILSFYYCMCMRRENHEIGSLLLDVKEKDATSEVGWLVFFRIRSSMVFNTITENDAAFFSLNNSNPKGKAILFRRFGFWLLVYLPFISVILILLSDVYFTFFYKSPWRLNTEPLWASLSKGFKIQLVAMDLFAVVAAITIWHFCKRAMTFHKGTRQITNEFRLRLLPNIDQKMDD